MQYFLSKRLSVPTVLAGLALAVLATGCGGGGGGTGGSTGASRPAGTTAEATTTEATKPEAAQTESTAVEKSSGPITKAEFVKRANAICGRRMQEAIEGVGAYEKQHAGSGQSQPALEAQAIYARFLPTIQEEASEIEALGAPRGDEAKVKAIVLALRRGIKASIEKEYDASNAQQFGGEFEHLVKLANAYELYDCDL